MDADRERARLLRLAYRMLGSWSEAEDVVQHSYERWYRLPPAERELIRNPAGWFTTVTSRLCWNLLDSARVRRERYVGPWLPEPLPAHVAPVTDPSDHAVLQDSVSMALLVALETLTPTERVAYILHEAFALPYGEIAEIVGSTPAASRQAAASARRRLPAARRRAVDPVEHARLVDGFQDACERGDLEALLRVLDPGATSTSDGDGRIGIARVPVRGGEEVARFVLGIVRRRIPGMSVERRLVNGAPGFAVTRTGLLGGRTVMGVVSFHVDDGRIRDIWMHMNPDKLTAWGS